MIELIFVIVIIGILTAVIKPKLDAMEGGSTTQQQQQNNGVMR